MAQKNNTTTITVRLDTETKKSLSRIALSERRSKSALASLAIAHFVAFHEAQIEGIKDAITSLDTGKGVRHDAVLAWVDSWDTDNELPSPAL